MLLPGHEIYNITRKTIQQDIKNCFSFSCAIHLYIEDLKTKIELNEISRLNTRETKMQQKENNI